MSKKFKSLKNFLFKPLSVLLTFIVGVFSSQCTTKTHEDIVMYGPASCSIQGTLTFQESFVPGIEVHSSRDTVLSSEQGNFVILVDCFSGEDAKLTFTDLDGEANLGEDRKSVV